MMMGFVILLRSRSRFVHVRWTPVRVSAVFAGGNRHKPQTKPTKRPASQQGTTDHHGDNRAPSSSQRRLCRTHRAFSARRQCQSVPCLRWRWPWPLSQSATKVLSGSRGDGSEAARSSPLSLHPLLLTTCTLILVVTCPECISSMDRATSDIDRQVPVPVHR